MGQAKARNQELHPDSYMGERDQNTWAIICCFLWYLVRDAGSELEWWRHKPRL